MALQSKQELFPGEEITVNYGYKVDSIFFVAQLEMISFLVLQISVVCIKSPLRFYLKVKDCMIWFSTIQLSFAPDWFQEQWFEHVREVECHNM